MKRLIKSKKIFDGRLLKLYLERQRYPDGYIANLEVIRHPGAVLIVPLLDKNKIILIKQYRPVINSFIWELPAGTLNKNESPLRCAKREMAEEIGYRARIWRKRGYIFPAPGYTSEKIIIYEARRLERIKFAKEEDELIVPRIFTKKQIRKLLKSKTIVDAKTICALKLTEIF